MPHLSFSTAPDGTEWVLVGIYDGFNGFNGPKPSEFLLSNLYKSIQKELKGLLWDDKPQADQVLDEISHPKSTSASSAVDRKSVLRALSQGLRNTEAAFLQMANKKATTNPELAVMGSFVLVMLMKGEDVYLMTGLLSIRPDETAPWTWTAAMPRHPPVPPRHETRFS